MMTIAEFLLYAVLSVIGLIYAALLWLCIRPDRDNKKKEE